MRFSANAGRTRFSSQFAICCIAATTAPSYPEQVFDHGNREFIVLFRFLFVGMADGLAGWNS